MKPPPPWTTSGTSLAHFHCFRTPLTAKTLFQQTSKHSPRVEVFFDYGPRRAAMHVVIVIQPINRLERLSRGAEGQQAVPARQEVAEACVLHDHGTAHRQIARAAIAEPSAARAHIGVFGDAELGARSPPIVLIGPQIARHFA